MNPWLAMLLGFCVGFVAATITWVLVSVIATYTSATATDKVIEEEVDRREKERERDPTPPPSNHENEKTTNQPARMADERVLAR